MHVRRACIISTYMRTKLEQFFLSPSTIVYYFNCPTPFGVDPKRKKKNHKNFQQEILNTPIDIAYTVSHDATIRV